MNPFAVAIGSGQQVVLPNSVLVRTRLFSGGEWSALEEAEFYVEPLAATGDLVISEINYNPYDPTPAELAVLCELMLRGPQTVGELRGRCSRFVPFDDLQAVTLNDVVTTLDVDPVVSLEQEQNLVAYIGSLPRDLRFGLVKALVKIPGVAEVLCKDDYDEVVLDAIEAISREAS